MGVHALWSTLVLVLGIGPGFSLVAREKGLAIEHDPLVIARLGIPGFGLGRLAGVGVHTLGVPPLVEAPGSRGGVVSSPLLPPRTRPGGGGGECLSAARSLGRLTGGRDAPVGTRFLAQPGTPLGTFLAVQDIAQPHPQSDTAQETEAQGEPPPLGRWPQSFLQPRLASERPTRPDEGRLPQPTQGPPGVSKAIPDLVPRVAHNPAHGVPTRCTLVWVQQIHESHAYTKTSEQPRGLHALLLLTIRDCLMAVAVRAC